MKFFFWICFSFFWITALAEGEADAFPKRVLITNDNGIDDVKLIALARAFSQHSETWVAAPMKDRSGSTHYLTLTAKPSVTVESRQLGKDIRAFAVDGFPADCVVWALAGPMRDNPPDLVISGINGGPNLGSGWLFSGTIGAARVAAFAGFPAIAVSGLDDDMPDAVSAAVDWVVRLAASSMVRDLETHHFLTVSIPRRPPGDIKGIRIARRNDVLMAPVLQRGEERESTKQIWHFKDFESLAKPTPGRDVALYEQGYVVVVPMKADEHDERMLSQPTKWSSSLPEWKGRASAKN